MQALTSGNEKTRTEDLWVLLDALRTLVPFTFASFGYNEWLVLQNIPITLTNKRNGEFDYNPNDAVDQKLRGELIQAYNYNEPGYILGLCCRCCHGDDVFFAMKELAARDDSKLTWSNIFTHNNYGYFRTMVLPTFSTYDDVHLVCNNKADCSRLPFRVDNVYGIGTNAWREDFGLSKTLPRVDTRVNKNRRRLFLLCAGPLGGILARRMHYSCPDSTCLDLGSALDPWLFPGARGLTRDYLLSDEVRRRACWWNTQGIPNPESSDCSVSSYADGDYYDSSCSC